MGKLIEREDKLVLDTNYPLTHKINRAKIKKYLNPDGSNPIGGFHRNRFDRLFLRDKIGTHFQVTNFKGTNKQKFVQHYK